MKMDPFTLEERKSVEGGKGAGNKKIMLTISSAVVCFIHSKLLL